MQLLFMPSTGVQVLYLLRDDSGDDPEQFHVCSLFRVEVNHADSIDKDLTHSAYLFRLKLISLKEVDLSERFFLSMSRHANLKYILLYNCNFDSDWLQHIAKCADVTWIDIENDSSHDKQQSNIIKSLKKNYALCWIGLTGINLTNQDVFALYNFDYLESLVLHSCEFQSILAENIFFEYIRNNLTLKSLVLKNIPNTEKYLQSIFEPRQMHVSITNNNITDDSLDGIIFYADKFKNITIRSNSISDKGLMKIQITERVNITLIDTAITQAGWDTFLKSNPNTTGYFAGDRVKIEYKRDDNTIQRDSN
jgi:hypothetical protein